MLDEKSLKEKYSQFKGVGKIHKEFPKKAGSRRSLSLPQNIKKIPKIEENGKCQKNEKFSKTRSISYTRKLKNGKNRLILPVTTETKLKPIFGCFKKLDKNIDKNFYPNPQYIIHPCKKNFNFFFSQELPKNQFK